MPPTPPLTCQDGAVTPTPETVFLQGLDFFSDVVGRIEPADWDRPTPCAGWRALDVLGHVGAAVRFGATLLRDGQAAWKPVDPPGGAVEGDPPVWWSVIASDARDAVSGVDLSAVVDAPRGPRSVGEGLSFPALDLFVHAWDLGRSIGLDVEIPEDITAFGRGLLEKMPANQVRSPAVFGDELTAPGDASPSDAFVAWTGRDPRWSSAS